MDNQAKLLLAAILFELWAHGANHILFKTFFGLCSAGALLAAIWKI